MSDDEQAGGRRKVIRTVAGVEKIKATCCEGHTFIAPNKGLGRASIDAWESRHQHRGQASS